MKTTHGEKLTVHRGNVHDYLGMDMEWPKDGKVTISMIKYMYQILDKFIEEIRKTSPTFVYGLFVQSSRKCDAARLPEELAVIFHHMVAQLLLHHRGHDETFRPKFHSLQNGLKVQIETTGISL